MQAAKRRSSFSWLTYDTYACAMLERHALLRELLQSTPVRRLKDVSFLGALELFSGVQQQPATRFDHSVGVAYLMLRACRRLRLPEREEQLLTAAALLHDVGHGALSHSIEAYFRRRFSVDHKTFTRRIILGDLFLGNEIAEILLAHDIDPLLLADTIATPLSDECRYLLHGPINVDTIDGIIRAASFFEGHRSHESPDSVLEVLIKPSAATQWFGDYFWELKSRIYNNHIYQLDWTIFDSMITRTLSIAKSDVRPDDFLLTDSAFKAKFGIELRVVRQLYDSRRSELELQMRMSSEFGRAAKRRTFSIDKDQPLAGPTDIPKRYSEAKSNYVSSS